ncbi:hypothetical protein HPB50_003191 [Hyalomma asiaticum]|uniref:Uncharacterized protein n=1 Tax=Hyalomma asiaticum TaxID=266040 RepID=A0ACB7S7F8_HYAAI|nr:hypothetical protein HPB50_003191 [Hyalomma asiaticum]
MEDQCQPGGGDLPQPPEIGHSYTAKYEMSRVDANHPAWVEEYFDYEGKRAKISATVLGVEFVDIYDYRRGTVTSYRLSRPAKISSVYMVGSRSMVDRSLLR